MKNRINEIEEKINKLSKQYIAYLNKLVNNKEYEYELEGELICIMREIKTLEIELEWLKSIYVYSK